MLVRTVSAIIGVGMFLALCFGGLLPFALGVTVLAALGIAEIVRAYRHVSADPAAGPVAAAVRPVAQTAGHGSLLLNFLLAGVGAIWPLFTYGGLIADRYNLPDSTARLAEAFLLVMLVGLFAACVFRFERTGKALGGMRVWYGVLGLAYIGMLFSSLVLLRGLPGRTLVAPFGEADRAAWLMLFVAVCVWATDSCAYLIGRSLGRTKLAPTLSPGKTREGALGGLAGAMIAGTLFAFWIHLPVQHGLVVGAMAGTVGQLGDLFESALKREIGLKDFGSLMPGHGGVLDRFDSLLFVTPLAYLYLHFLAGL